MITSFSESVLHLRHKAVVKLLIDSGDNVNIQEKNGCTAFDMATIIGESDNKTNKTIKLNLHLYDVMSGNQTWATLVRVTALHPSPFGPICTI